MDCALHALAPRARSRSELHDHLIKRGVEAEVAVGILDSLELQGLLNDLEFAKLWAESRQRQKKLSKRVISSELRQKGVAQDIIDEALLAVSDDDELRMATELVEKKVRALSRLTPEVRKRRLFGLLARKGYHTGIALRVIQDLEASDLYETDTVAEIG